MIVSKKIWLLCLLMLVAYQLPNAVFAKQTKDPVKWTTNSKDLGNNEHLLTFSATIDDGWAVYSKDVGEGGPIPAKFDFSEVASKLQLVGPLQELGKAKEGYDDIFEMNVKKYFDKLTFKAKVKTKNPSVKVEIPLLYMSCNDVSCVRLEEYFDFTLKTKAPQAPAEKPAPKKTTPPPAKKVEATPSKKTLPTPPAAPVKSDAKKQENTKSTNKASFIPTASSTVAKENKTVPAPKVNLTDATAKSRGRSSSKSSSSKNNTSNNAKASSSTDTKKSTTNNTDVESSDGKKKKKKKKRKKKKSEDENQEKAEENQTPNNTTNSLFSSQNRLNLTNNGQSNVLEPVKWSFNIEELGEDQLALNAKAILDDGWYIYSQNVDEGGPVPTSFEFEPTEGVELLDKQPAEISEHKKEGFDPIFEMDVTKYSKSVIFQQKVKLADPNAKIKGSLRYMTCDDTKCLPPTEEYFIFSKSGSGLDDGTLSGDATDAVETIPTNVVGGKAKMEVLQAKIKDCGTNADAKEKAARTLWMTFLLGFLGGFAALLTPCVFPMIPLTVSFFTKRSKDKRKGIQNALIYALSIIVIYVALGFLVTAAFGPDTLNILATNVWFNLAFFVVFVIFAISFFGYFEITLPSGLVNQVSAAEEKGGLLGIFFMAFTLALVSFSCTGPIIGTLLVDAAVNGERIGPIVGMTGFATALALPFAFFAAFPGWLNTLPRSGGWLNTVKVMLGFIELIFALKFLSNADLVQQWWILPREIFLVIWIVLFVCMALYMIGWIKFPHDSPIRKLSFSRIGMSVACLAAAIYLIPGIFCNSLPLVSGFPPPIFYSLNCGGDGHTNNIAAEEHIRDLEEGIAEAKKTGKPIMIDFTGWACVNCRKMEENVWPNEEITPLLNQYTLVSLYVDEDIALPKEEQFEYFLNEKKRKVKTVGNKWSYLEFSCFGANTQPYYVLLNEDGELLNTPRGYTPDVGEYADFLKKGLINHENGQSISSR